MGNIIVSKLIDEDFNCFIELYFNYPGDKDSN